MTLRSLLPICAALAISASAAPIYDNGPPNKKDGSEMTHWIEADDFTLGVSTRVENITFWDFEIPGNFYGTVVWQIYANSGSNSPGSLLHSGTSVNLNHTATGFSVFGAFKEFINTFDISPVVLPPGTYWLALHNGPLSNNAGENVFWEATNNPGANPSHADIAPFTGNWYSNEYPELPSELAFQVSGVVGPTVKTLGVASSVARITFTTTAQQKYRVEYKNNLTDAQWVPVAGAEMLSGTGDVVEATDSDPTLKNLPRRFYRVVLL